ncbi:type IX secretion system protein PorQ [Flavobacteriaceae bacterium]|nr:type IX secretion system protein PorQ [Flavobacteriaceae bacterium]
MKKLLLIFFLSIFQNLFSQTGGETLFAFLNTPTSPKQIALGGNILTAATDVSQTLWNPSIADTILSNEVAVNYVNYIADINVGSFAYAKNIHPKYGTAFIGGQFFNYGDFDRTNADSPTVVGSFGASDLSINLGYAIRLHEWSIGATAKFINSKIDVYSASAVLYDIGFTYYHPLKPFVFSVVMRNLGGSSIAFIDRADPISSEITAAFEYQLEHVPIKIYGAANDLGNWDVSVPNPSRSKTDLENNITEEKISDINNLLRHLSLGAELWPQKKINLRIGYNHRRAQEFQLSEVKTKAGLSYGLAFNAKKFRFDYAFSKFQEGAKFSTFGLTFHL